MQDDTELLRLMMEDQERQGPLYRPGPHWRAYQRRIVHAIRKHGLARFRSLPAIGKGYADVAVADPAELWPQGSVKTVAKQAIMRMPGFRQVVDQYQKNLRSRNRQIQKLTRFYYKIQYDSWFQNMKSEYSIPETLHGGAEVTVELDGDEVSELYVIQLLRIHNFCPFANFDRAQSIFEIGGGYGSNMHLLLTMFPNIRKVIYLDIPPVLYVATQYLREFFPEAVVDYRATRSVQEITFQPDDRREIICICPWQIPRIDSRIDVFWNAASFAEMPQDVVVNYAKYARQLVSRPDGLVLLALQTPLDRPDDGGPDGYAYGHEIMAAFEPTFAFEAVPPRIEAETPSIHYRGHFSQ